MGANGQHITVLPAMEMVLAHKVDFDVDGSRQISPEEFHAILGMVISSPVTVTDPRGTRDGDDWSAVALEARGLPPHVSVARHAGR